VLEEVKKDQELRRIPVVILTTCTAEQDILRPYDSYSNCYITKPVDLRKKEIVEEIPPGSGTIPVVRDEESVRRLVAKILEKQGYNVLEASNGVEALMICEKRKEPIHLILADVVMPEMSGPQWVERLREICKDFEVLYMSGYTDNTIVHHGVLDRGLNYIQKPFTPESLARNVRKVSDIRTQDVSTKYGG
jgi:CheY-like chemotaxis protein